MNYYLTLSLLPSLLPPFPSAINGVEDVLVTLGLGASLFCNASGNPALTYLWTGEGGQGLTSVPRLYGVETDTLYFTDVSTSNASNYTCTVSLFDSVIGTAVGELTTRGGDILPTGLGPSPPILLSDSSPSPSPSLSLPLQVL